MSTGDYLPRQDSVLIVWLNQFKTELASLSATFGLVEADITTVNNHVATIQTSIQHQAAQKAEHKASTAAKKQALKLLLPQFRALVRRIKTHAAYTPELGQQLGIVGPQGAPMSADVAGSTRPQLAGGAVRNGSVEIRFRKNGFTGVVLSCRRGTEGSYVPLGKQLFSPFVDERVNLAAGPETRFYQAWYLDGDEVIGEASDILVLTVPETGMPTVEAKAA